MEWKAVSNTATWGTSVPKTSWHARIPCTWAGLCSGAKGFSDSMPFSTSSVIKTDLLKIEPPCTTRCPMAATSFKLWITPTSSSIKASFTNWNACVWSSISVVRFFSLPSNVLCEKIPSFIPIRSQIPFAATDSFSISINWYFREELPALMTKIFIVFPPIG